MIADEYVGRAQAMDQSHVVRAWDAVCSGRVLAGWPPGRAFEHIILRQFEIEGARVVWPFTVDWTGQVLEQIDGAVYVDGVPYIVEAKDRGGEVNYEPIAKLTSQLQRRPPGTMGLVFSRNGFTEPAKILARFSSPVRILMWEYGDIDAAVRRACILPYLRRKYQMAIQEARPDHSVSVEDRQ